MPIELVVFDMAGTTVNDENSVSRCVQEVLAEVGLPVSVADVNAVMGIPKPEAIRRLVETSSRRRELLERVTEIHDRFVARAIWFYKSDASVREVPGTSAVFETLRNANIKVALDTGFDRAIARVILGRLGWIEGEDIDASVCSDEVARGRPHPDMILSLMKRLGVREPSNVAKVGDTPADLREGACAGCGLVIGVTEGTHTMEQLANEPYNHLISSVRDLPPLLGLRGF